MAGERGWFNVSFTPRGKPAVHFGEVGLIFPSKDVLLFPERGEFDSTDTIGPIDVRILSSNVGAIPTFAKGQIGTFQGTRPEDGVVYSATNAKVVDSKPGDLLLQSDSLDGETGPVAFARIGPRGGSGG